jgi:hypothetical protein
MDSNNVDNYPLMKPSGTEALLAPIEFYTVAIVAIMSALIIGAAYLAKERKGKKT